MEVGLGPGDMVLGGDQAPSSPKEHSPPQFSTHVCCGQMAGWIKMPLHREVDLDPGDIVLDGDPAPPKGAQPPIFGPCLLWSNSWVDQYVTWYRGRPQPRPHSVRWDPAPPPERGTAASLFFLGFVALKMLSSECNHFRWLMILNSQCLSITDAHRYKNFTLLLSSVM